MQTSGFRLRASGQTPGVWSLFPLFSLCVALSAQRPAPVAFLSFDDARGVVETFASVLPIELKSQTPVSLAAFWPDWVIRSDAQTRARRHPPSNVPACPKLPALRRRIARLAADGLTNREIGQRL